MFQTFLNSVWSSISSMIDLLKDSSIGNYMFGGVSLWLILITFFAGWIVLRFFLNGFSGRGDVFSWSKKDG